MARSDRWYEHNKLLKSQATLEAFESVAVVANRVAPVVASTINIKIHLPNQIRCDVAIDLNGLSPLLTQLVQLC